MEQQYGSNAGNPWFSVSVGLLGLIVGYSLSSGITMYTGGGLAARVAQVPAAGDQAAPEPSDQDLTPPTVDDDMTLGSDDAPITLIEFSDMQCPFCRKWFRETFADLKRDYIDTGKVKLVYRDYPLSFHPGALPAAMAVECAHDQSTDLAWAMHDTIMAEQDKINNPNMAEFTTDDLKKWASSLKALDQKTFDDCLDSNKHEQEIKDDELDGQDAGVQGTPGFWVLGPDGQQKLISGAYPIDEFKAAFDAMLE